MVKIMSDGFKIPLIVISGTNASGKSSLGIELANKYNGEIISADSRQIFRNFDLCCGKITMKEKALVQHHMIDICNIEDKFSVFDYQKQVYAIIPQIIEHGKLPFIVGGTGLYIDAVVKGYDFENEIIDPGLRKVLEKKTIPELQSMLSVTAIEFLRGNNSDFNNKRRLIRIIEKEKNGRPLSNKNNPLFNVLQIGVTWPTELLYKRIDERLANRIEQGMIDEVRNYIQCGGNPQYLYGLGLEYRYITWYLDGKYTSLEEFTLEMSHAIKRYAKQQMKWFKRSHSIHWLDMTQDYFTEACDLIDGFLSVT